MDPEEVQQYLDRLDEGGYYLKAVFSEHDHTRWLGTTESGYLWVIPGEGRKRQSGKDDARSTLRHYDSLQIVPESEAPSTVVKMDRGLRAFTDGGTEQTDTGRFRPPSETVAHMSPTANHEGLERRVCPNCRLYFDTGEKSAVVFCSRACRERHQQGRLMADGGQPATGTEQFSVLDATTGGKHIWHEEMEDADHVIFADRRKVPDGLEHQPSWECLPDVLCDFRRLPFADESFDLICFDPPHRVNDEGMERLTGVVLKKYGALAAETWQADLRAGFDELWRVLRPGGTLTFKWADETKSHGEVLDLLDQTPHFGVTTEKKRAVVKWHLFHKPREAAPQQPEEKPLVTDGGYDVAIITDDFVRATAAPAQEAKSWCYVEIDDPTRDADGYWFPCRLPRSDVGDDRDAVPDPDQLAHDDILQFPLETRQPELAGGALPPEGTKDRVVEDPLDDYLPQGGDA